MKSIKSVVIKTTAMLALAIVSNSLASTEAQSQPAHAALTGNENSIRFVSTEADMLVFELHLDTLLPKGSLLRVSDEDNNVILEERTAAGTYNIRYKIARNDMSRIHFEISGKGFLLNQSFDINSWSEEKLEVKKV